MKERKKRKEKSVLKEKEKDKTQNVINKMYERNSRDSFIIRLFVY
jgi:hypothetical protein